jgi:hypothetical protein
MGNDHETNGNGKAGDAGDCDVDDADAANPHLIDLDLVDFLFALDRWRDGLVWIRRSLPTSRPDLHPIYQRVFDKTVELKLRIDETFDALEPRLRKLRGTDYEPPPWVGL